MIAPLVESSCRLPGSAPLVTDQFLYGGVPPLAVRLAEYGRFTVHAGSVPLMTGGAEPTVSG